MWCRTWRATRACAHAISNSFGFGGQNVSLVMAREPLDDELWRSRRRVLVTGGGRGLGAAIVAALAADGHDVTFTFRSAAAEAQARSGAAAGLSGAELRGARRRSCRSRRRSRLSRRASQRGALFGLRPQCRPYL